MCIDIVRISISASFHWKVFLIRLSVIHTSNYSEITILSLFFVILLAMTLNSIITLTLHNL